MKANSNKNILCTWEIGGDLGHLVRLAKVVKLLEAQGFNVFVALHDLSRAHEAFDESNATLLQAPVWLPRMSMQRPIACLADTLLLSGYLDVQPLYSLVRGWQSIVAFAKPDLVIFDYSPTAMLAMQGLNVPKIKIGSGFADPVPGQPIADWRPYKTSDNLVQRQEQKVLQAVNAVLERLNLPELMQLSDLFQTDQTIVSVYDVIDPYRGMRAPTDYCVGKNRPITHRKCVFERSNLPKVLAYIKSGYPHLAQVAKALSDAKANVYFVCPGGDMSVLQPLISKTFSVSNQAVDFADAFPRIDAFVGHGNSNTVTEAIYHSVPILVLPLHLEQLLIGMKLKESGAGDMLMQMTNPQDVTGMLEMLLASSSYAASARVICAQPGLFNMPLEHRALDVVNQLLS